MEGGIATLDRKHESLPRTTTVHFTPIPAKEGPGATSQITQWIPAARPGRVIGPVLPSDSATVTDQHISRRVARNQVVPPVTNTSSVTLYTSTPAYQTPTKPYHRSLDACISHGLKPTTKTRPNLAIGSSEGRAEARAKTLVFPEDYLIHRKRLIRLWIAEGFIEQKGPSRLEDIAEGYLRELVQRSMLQVAQRNSFDGIKCIQMHDLVRELAIFQCKREGFSTTYDGNNEAMLVGPNSRRVAVLQCSKGIPSNIDASRLRTFITFDTSRALSSWYSSISSKLKYLAVLDLSGLSIETIPSSIGELFNLRLLCLDNTQVKELPKSITQLQNLQTLSIKEAQIVKLPEGLSKLKKLRHLLVKRMQDVTYRSFKNWEGVKPFKGLWSLIELQTLWDIKASEVFVTKLGNLSQLRCLGVCDVRSNYCAQLCGSLSKMDQLSRLVIRACSEDELLQLDDLTFPNPLGLLGLDGRLSEGTFTSPFFINHGNRLLQLELRYSQLSENLVPRLSGLSNLTWLSLTKAYTGQELDFHVGWFLKLKELRLDNLPRLNQIRIEKGALTSLKSLTFHRLPELREVPVGFRYMQSLTVKLGDMHPDFASSIHPYLYGTTAQV